MTRKHWSFFCFVSLVVKLSKKVKKREGKRENEKNEGERGEKWGAKEKRQKQRNTINAKTNTKNISFIDINDKVLLCSFSTALTLTAPIVFFSLSPSFPHRNI